MPGWVRYVALVPLLAGMAASSDLVYSPSDFASVEGGHVVVFFPKNAAEDEKYRELAEFADSAWVTAQEITGLRVTATPGIVVVEEETPLIEAGLSPFFALESTVHLTDEVFLGDQADMLRLLRLDHGGDV